MKTLKIIASILLAVCVPRFASANLTGPYTPDANTLFLLHFDEAAGGSVTANSGSKGGNFYTVTNATTGNGLATPPPVTTLLGQASYAGFGNAVRCTNVDGLVDGMVGYDGNKNGAYDADVQGGPASPDAIALTNLNIGFGGSSPFTLEALIAPTTISVNQEVMCTDDYNGTRGFQFKITSTGQLQFNLIPIGGGSFSFPIPTTGTHKFVPGQWYHVAVVYNGTSVSLYWTQLDPSNNVANLLGSGNVAYSSSSPAAPLVIGAENRGSDQESLQGLMDEVRISSVARPANGMQFYSPVVTISPNPASQNIDDGQPVTFTVGASSLTTLGYQWRFNGVPIPGATAIGTSSSSYSIASVSLTNVGNYDCVVTNTSGNSATSSPAMLIVGAGNFLAHRYSFTADTTDSIGGATGTNFGNATVTGGKLVLDGTTGTYMRLPGGLFQGLQAATFDFWATYGTISGNNDRVLDFGNTNGVALGVPGQPNNYLYFSPHSGTVNRLTATPGTSEFEQTVSASGILDGQTLHVTCVVDQPDSYLAIYTNGVLEAVNTNYTVPFLSLSDGLAYVGRSLFADLNGDAYLNASIDELRIYSGALSSNSVLQSDQEGPNVVLSDGPVQLLTQPASATSAPGLKVTFTGTASGHQPIIYQWFENGSPISGATNTAYSFYASLSQNGHTFQIVATNNITGTNYFAASTNATLTVVNPPTLSWLGTTDGGQDNTWNTTSPDWTNDLAGGGVIPFVQSDGVLFDDRAGGGSVDLEQAINPYKITVNAAASYTFGSAGQLGSLTGQGFLIKQNSGTLIMDVTNTMSGPVTISGGTLQIGNNDTLGAIGSPVTNNASLVFNRSDTATMPSPIYGTGTVTVNSGTVAATGSNYYTGPTIINSGTVTLGNAAGLGATNGSITVNAANSAELYITANVDLGLNALNIGGSGVSSGGALRKGGAGVSTVSGQVTLTADTTLNVDGGATLNLTNASGLNGAGANANLTLAGSGAGNISGPLALGSGALTVAGGTWTVAPNNNYTGGTTLNTGGILRITGPLSLGPVPGSFNASQVNFSTGGQIDATTNIILNDGNIGITISANSTLAVETNATFTIANNINGAGSVYLTKAGPGALVLNGANGFQGSFYVDTFSQTANDGKLVLANNAAFANVLAFAGFPGFYIRNQNAGSSTLALDGTTGSLNLQPDVSINGRNNAVPAIENLAGDNIISGNIAVGAGGGTYEFQSDSGTLTLSANLPYSTPTSGRIFTFLGAGSVNMSGAIQNGSLDSTSTSNVWISVVKTGTGVLNLPAANTYSGTTTISNGVVSLTGSLGSGAVTVAGGLLVGSGSIAGPVSVASGGSIEAGGTNSIGTLTLGGSLALAGNTLVKINNTAGTHDLFTGQTGVIYGGTLTVTNLSGALALNDNFTLFSPGASTSNFSSITGSPGSGLAYSFTNGVLSVVASTIANNPTNISFSVSGNTLTLTWPMDHLGWILQAQTNALSAGLKANWVDVAGSSSSTQSVITVSTTNPAVFYRLRHP